LKVETIIDEFTEILVKNCKFINHGIVKGTIHISTISNRNEVVYPFYGGISVEIYSYYSKSFKDLLM